MKVWHINLLASRNLRLEGLNQLLQKLMACGSSPYHTEVEFGKLWIVSHCETVSNLHSFHVLPFSESPQYIRLTTTNKEFKLGLDYYETG